MGAAQPMVAKPGTRPIANVDPPIKTKVNKKVYLRPIKSPNLPKTNAPNGLIIKPAAKMASVLNSAEVPASDGKNCFEIIVANMPKM